MTHLDVEPDLVIRRATPEDVPALVEVATDAFRETYRLIDDPHDEARRRHCQTLWLGVYERNERARTFYKRWGFVDVGTKEFAFGGRTYFDPIMASRVPREP